MHTEVVILRLIHVLGGVFWVGGMLVMGLFVMPALASAGPAAGAVMAGLNQKKFPVVMPIVALLTILSGIRLMMIDSANFAGAWFASPVGRTFSTAGGLALLAFLFGMMLVRPAMMKALSLGQQMAGADEAAKARITAEMAAARKRGQVGNLIVIVLLVLAALGMATARYMG
jgi:uncharacterized membrane protein